MTATIVKKRGINRGLATRHVSLNLNKSDGDRYFVWEHLSLESVEEFTANAKSWLGDKSNLSEATIENADYAELLNHFREMADWKPKAKRAPKPKATSAKEHNKAVVRKAFSGITAEPVRKPRVKKTVAVKVDVPTVVAVIEEKPQRTRADVPKNWVDMTREANTPIAREWWKQWIERWIRGEVS